MDIVKIRKKAKELREKKDGRVEKDTETSTQSGAVQQSVSRAGSEETTLRTESASGLAVTGEEIQKAVITPETGETRIQQVSTEGITEELPAQEEFFDEKELVIEVPQIEVLEFLLGDEEYGVMLEDVREIIRMKPITEVPRAPVFIRGIISLRGTMIPVIDLKIRLKLGETQISPATRIVIISDDSKYFGVIVDKINGVVKIREDMIEPTPPTISPDVSEFIKGLGKYGEKIVRLLDLHKLSIVEIGTI